MAAKTFLNLFFREAYLFFLPFFFVLKQYNENKEAISPGDALWMGTFYFLLLIIIRTLFYKWQQGKAAMLVIAISLIFFFFGFLRDSLMPGSFFTRYSFLLPAILFFLLVIFFTVKKSPWGFQKLLNYFNLLFIALFLWELAFVGKNAKNLTPVPALLSTKCDSCMNPDIYLIVSDEYAGQQQLKDMFQFDNSLFLNALENRGFTVMQGSRSNYNSTSYSLASFLNLNYLELSSTKENQQDIDRNIRNIQNNNLFRFLLQKNYSLHNYSVFNLAGRQPPHSSMFFIRGKRRIHFQTLAGRMEKDLEYHLVTTLKWNWQLKRMANKRLKRTEEIIDLVKKSAMDRSEQPKLVYAHFMMPHFPYLLDSTGKLNQLNSLVTENWTDKKEYIGYLQYSNKRFLEVMDHIQKNSIRPYMILFMSDHGFRYIENKKENQPYHFMNISAVYLPGKLKANFYSGITTVNVGREIMNQVFGQQLPLLRDSTVFIR